MASEYLNNKVFESLIVKFQFAKREKIKYQMLMEDIRSTEQRTAKRGKFQKPLIWAITEESYYLSESNFNLLQKELAVAFYLLAENIVKYKKFNFVDQDDAIQDAVWICFEKIDRFDPSKGKAFNYLTTCVFNLMKQMYRSAKNYNDLKAKYLDYVTMQMGDNQKILKKTAFSKQNKE